MSEYLLELKDISKTFPGVVALDKVQFNLGYGEIHALMGENGAGKSTLIKVITGVHQPDSGEILFEGKPVVLKDPKESQRLGIGAVYQHITCYPHLSVAENIFLGHEKINPITRKIDWKDLQNRARDLLSQLDADFDPKTTMGSLSIARQQIVEIAKALSTNARVLVMDEPTAPLTNRESEDLYRITESLRDKGVSVIFISHRLEDIYRIASRVTVFRDAQFVGSWGINGITKEKLITAMVGREITQFFPRRSVEISEEVLRVEGLGRTGIFKDVSFAVRKGEILALTGLVGAGRTEVCEAIYGIAQADSGRIYLEGREIHVRHPQDALKCGIAFLPEDRLKQGLILDWDLCKNISLPALKKFSLWGWLREVTETTFAGSMMLKLMVKTKSVFSKAATLSGGNQQKIVVAKLLTNEMKVIILDEPTKGVDVGAKTAIFGIMNDLAAAGYGIIMISSEMPEVLGMSDRVLVMREGRSISTFETKNTSQEELLHAAMVG